MAKLVPENHPALHSIAEEVTPEEIADGSLKKLLKDMRLALKEYDVDGYTAVAIAAPQVGAAKRVFIVEDQSDDRDSLPSFVAVNPRIVKSSKKSHVVGEGCLSVPDRYGLVRRSTNVTLRALDENGEEFERGAGGLLAQIIQHEVGHLDGTLFVDVAERVYTKEELAAQKNHRKEAGLE